MRAGPSQLRSQDFRCNSHTPDPGQTALTRTEGGELTVQPQTLVPPFRASALQPENTAAEPRGLQTLTSPPLSVCEGS